MFNNENYILKYELNIVVPKLIIAVQLFLSFFKFSFEQFFKSL
jgi:hypothetical protein